MVEKKTKFVEFVSRRLKELPQGLRTLEMSAPLSSGSAPMPFT